MTDTPMMMTVGVHPTQWTLERACAIALERHWKGMRKYAHELGRCADLVEFFPDKALDTLTADDCRTYLDTLRHGGLGDEAVRARMANIRTVYKVAKENGYKGPEPVTPKPRVKRRLKWWLKPQDEPRVLGWLLAQNHPDYTELHDLVIWTVETGLRIEESLRVHAGCFIALGTGQADVDVPGTKTSGAQRTIPLRPAAEQLAERRLRASTTGLLFELPYWRYCMAWRAVRIEFGWKGDHTSTLKSLRRSFTRKVSSRVPLPVLSGMLGHGTINTTMEYLRLTGGGYTAAEMRQWLNDENGMGIPR